MNCLVIIVDWKQAPHYTQIHIGFNMDWTYVFQVYSIVHTTWTKAKHGPTERLICALPYLFEYGIFRLNGKWVSFVQFDSAFFIKLDSKAYSKAGIGTVFY